MTNDSMQETGLMRGMQSVTSSFMVSMGYFCLDMSLQFDKLFYFARKGDVKTAIIHYESVHS